MTSWGVNGLPLYSALLTSGHSKLFTILPHMHPLMRTFTHRRRSQPRKDDSRLVGIGQGEASRSGTPRHYIMLYVLPGDPTSWLQADLLYLLSHMPARES